MRALIVLCAAALAVGMAGCKKHDTSDSGSTAPPMEQPSQTPPPAETTPPAQPSTEMPPAETPPAPDSGTTPPPAESAPPNQ